MSGEVEEILAAFLEAKARGEEPDVRALLARHQEHRAELEARLRVLGGIDDCFALIRSPVVEEPPAALSETAIPGYRILGKIGSGGMASVHLAEHSRLGRLVVIKIMSSSAVGDERAVARFAREARALARLAHPAIVPIHEFSEHDGVRFLALEFIPGVDLAALIARLQGLAPPIAGAAVGQAVRGQVAELARLASSKGAVMPATEECAAAWTRSYPEICARATLDVAAALQYAHERGIVHRDVKPSNIILSTDGRAHLVDFGLVLSESAATLTRAADFLGTAQYGAPEQLSGDAHGVGPQSDVFSLGVVLYELLTLRRPFSGKTIPEVMERVLHEDPVPPRRLVPTIPAELDTICLTALEKTLEHRYASASELANDLRRFIEGRPIRARPPSLAAKLSRQVRRRPVTTALGVAGVAAMTVLAHHAIVAERRAGAARLTSIESQERLARLGREARLDLTKERYLRLLSQAEVLVRTGEEGRAVVLLSEAASLEPSDARAYLARAGARIAGRRQLRQALADLRRAEAIEGPTRASLRLKGAAFDALGDASASIEADRAFIRLFPGDPEVLLRLGSKLLAAGSREEGLTRLRSAVELDPGSVQAEKALGLGHLSAGDHGEAVKVLGALVKRAPSDQAARAAYAEALTRAGDLRGGERQFVLCLQLRPNDRGLLEGLAGNLIGQGRAEDALEAYRRIVTSSGGDSGTYLSMGAAYESLRRLDDAANAYDKARLLAASESERSRAELGLSRVRPR